MKISEDWIEDIRKLSKLVEQQDGICQQIADWISKNVQAPDVFPKALPVDIGGMLLLLQESTRETKLATATLWERMCATPAAKFMDGQLLTREEFHLLASRGVLTEFSRGPWGAPYDVFEMYYYDDGQHRCYINPNLRPRTDRGLQLRVGALPEELNWAGLSSRQRAYYEQWLPAVARRFRRDPAAAGEAAGKCLENTSSQLRVLIVTDDSEAGTWWAKCIKLLGHVAIAVDDRASAVSVAAGWRPDVALLDIQLEDGDTGYELAKSLRSCLGGTVCLVAHTGYLFAEIWRQFGDAGFDEFLQKPAHPDELRRLLETQQRRGG